MSTDAFSTAAGASQVPVSTIRPSIRPSDFSRSTHSILTPRCTVMYGTPATPVASLVLLPPPPPPDACDAKLAARLARYFRPGSSARTSKAASNGDPALVGRRKSQWTSNS